MADFMILALLAAVGAALAAGPLGCLLMWRRLSLMGDTLAHGSVLGLAAGFLTGMAPMSALLVLTTVWVFLLWFLKRSRWATTDSVLAFLTQSSLALAILLFALAPAGSLGLMSAFIGNILTVSRADAALIWGMNGVVLVLLMLFWKKWVLIAINADLAKTRGIAVSALEFLFLLMTGFFIACGIQVMGALLAPAFLVIPAMAARPFSRTPEKMALFASLIALLSAVLGLWLSFEADVPTGPVMVTVALGFYVFSYAITALIKNMLRNKALSSLKK